MKNHVLSVASEAVPLIKTGGLADVAGALPQVMSQHGWHMRVLMPAYTGLVDQLEQPEVCWESDDVFGQAARVVQGQVNGADFLLLDIPSLYQRAGGIYIDADGEDYPDHLQRFAALSWVAYEIARDGLNDGWRPSIVHAHDWQAALAPAYLRYYPVPGVRSILTIHNIAFQGNASADLLSALKLPAYDYHPDGLEYYGHISALKAGLINADWITTVSPNYANELMRSDFGMGLSGVIESRIERVSGILNGVDTSIWDPESDPLIHATYSAKDSKRKADNKAALRSLFGLQESEGPLCVVVSRLTHQKGLDMVLDALPTLVERGGSLALIGTGDQHIEASLLAAAEQYPGRVGVKIDYDEALSHQIFAGGDAVLVPSRFEPCGLTQLYGLRYGTVPLVSATGGLADTVIDANAAAINAGVATGFCFFPTDALAMRQSIERLCACFQDADLWHTLLRNAMRQSVSWERSGAEYARLYDSLLVDNDADH